MDLENLGKWARIKGINLLGTGDFTHPLWFKEIKNKLEPTETGLYKLKNNVAQKIFNVSDKNNPIFILTSEISCIYSKNNKTRKIHILVFSPDIQTVEKINAYLGRIGNIKSDGRPILGLDAKELAKIVFDINPNCVIIPAHIWTPWFSIFGSKSGFDSIEECFEEYTKYIFAAETGLSSDPEMNRRLSALDKISLISNSDSHSPSRIGRESNVFNVKFPEKISYDEVIKIIKEKNPTNFLYTVEFFPEEGRYHYDGHRLCQVRFSPQESRANNNICPKCGKPLTIGVMNRVDELADRAIGDVLPGAVPFKSLIPLEEIIADAISKGVKTKAVGEYYNKLIETLGNEYAVLLDSDRLSIEKASSSEITEGIIRVRERRVEINPGYDGEYGKIKIFRDEEKKRALKQKVLF
jgi:uncharacterized protein (TIGR00375 family)